LKLRLLKEGFGVQDHSENPKKKTGFTESMKLRGSSVNRSPQRDPKDSRAHNLSTANPEVFGNGTGY